MVAYVDLSARLVLATNEHASLSRNALNDLCKEAVDVAKAGALAVVGTATELKIFISDDAGQEAGQQDGLICLCGVDADVVALIEAAQSCLSELQAAGE